MNKRKDQNFTNKYTALPSSNHTSIKHPHAGGVNPKTLV